MSEMEPTGIPPELTRVRFTLSTLHGFDRTIGVARLDASRILFADGKYHLWYTRFEHRERWEEIWPVPNHTEIWLAVSEDGWNWREVGNVMADGGTGFWPAAGRHAPYVVFQDGHYFMFFTGQLGPRWFDKRIGLAVADNCRGPFKHHGNGPLLPADSDSEVYDSVGQDDACVLRRDGQYWLYFKGYGFDKVENKIVNNQICIATAAELTGPYERFGNNPVTQSHTGCAWPHRQGVALISDRHPSTVRYSDDGRHFQKASEVTVSTEELHLRASLDACRHYWGVGIADPGVFLCEGSTGWEGGKGVSWGISQLPDVEYAPAGALQAHHYPFLVRFDCGLTQETEQPVRGGSDRRADAPSRTPQP